MLKAVARQAIAAIVGRHGYTLKPATDPPRGFANFLRFARRQGLAPRTVFDIGVGTGTPWLYDAFPQAHFVLLEALPAFEPDLVAITRRIDAEYHLVGVGAADGRHTIMMSPDVPTSSSLYAVHADRAAHPTNAVAERIATTIDIRTLDSLAHHAPPFLLKIDIEGAELDALRGAATTLWQTQMVIVELSVMRRYAGEGSFAEIVGLLAGHGFRLYDIIELDQLGADGPLSYIDTAFVPEAFPATSGSG
jgi:FkbM family methyltransferase